MASGRSKNSHRKVRKPKLMIRRRIEIFTDRYPLLGPFIYVLSIQYYVIQLIVAAAWQTPYSWLGNVISDLGNTTCGEYGGRLVCSPRHDLMNASFVVLGLTMAIGSLLIYQEFKKSRASLVGFSLMAVAGAGTLMVGLFPENTIPVVHSAAALLPFVLGNVSLLVLGSSLQLPRALRIITIGAGAVALAALPLFLTEHYLGLGRGGMERLVAYPQTFWLIAFGAYMSHKHWGVSG